MGNAWLSGSQAGIKIVNINNLRYAYDISLMPESEDELKSLLMKVNEESEKIGLKLNLLYGPVLLSVHDYWKNHSFNDTGLCLQSDVSAF